MINAFRTALYSKTSQSKLDEYLLNIGQEIRVTIDSYLFCLVQSYSAILLAMFSSKQFEIKIQNHWKK